jgi:2-haloalkanoic acid dehalogenase type II
VRGLLPRAILLDYYGTVVEEDDVPIGKICNEISQTSRLRTTAVEIASYWSRLFRELCNQSFGDRFQTQKELELISLQHVLEHFEADLDASALSESLYDYWAHPAIFPKSKEVLAECRIPVCIVSNIDNAELQSALSYNDLRFDWIVTSEDCRAYKPRSELFEKALSLLGLSAGEVLHVGDSLNSDVRGAKSQGIRVLWINRKKREASSADETPEYISTDLTGLSAFFERNGAAESGEP